MCHDPTDTGNYLGYVSHPSVVFPTNLIDIGNQPTFPIPVHPCAPDWHHAESIIRNNTPRHENHYSQRASNRTSSKVNASSN